MSFKKGDFVQVLDFLSQNDDVAGDTLALKDHGAFGTVMRKAQTGDERVAFDGRTRKLDGEAIADCFLVMFAGKPLSNEGAHTDFINKCWLRPATQQMMDEQRSR